MDSITASKTRLEFARICIEIGATDIFPKHVDVILKDGGAIYVSVDVPWLPPNYRNYGVFGHIEKNCFEKLDTAPVATKVWIKKRTLNEKSEAPASGNETLPEQEKVVLKLPVLRNTNEGGLERDPVFTGTNSVHVATVAEQNHIDRVLENINVIVIRSGPVLIETNSVHVASVAKGNHNDAGQTFPELEDLQAEHSSALKDSDCEDESIAPEQSYKTDACKETQPSSNSTHGRSRPVKDHSKAILAGSRNKFDILNSIEENSSVLEGQARKVRTESLGVASLLNDLKKKKKYHLDKAISSRTGGNGGASNSPT
ncbi:uncharacterized protein LOC120153011 [Hibiscus syriacus]|uniref:uncharacterized protein LOC120153011 n=1 Tax=Hibiscus syriacus TaxID=106335 RepID=UPI001924826D|nr:uncharacterized protein LOC120153011 [Hibiscus syriacus]